MEALAFVRLNFAAAEDTAAVTGWPWRSATSTSYCRRVDGVTFTVPTGQVTGLLGPSGCGKTSLMRCIVGVQVVEVL